MPTKPKQELIGIAEIAELAQVGASAVSNWRTRSITDPFPKPLAKLRSGPVFDKAEVVAWLARNSKLESIQDA